MEGRLGNASLPDVFFSRLSSEASQPERREAESRSVTPPPPPPREPTLGSRFRLRQIPKVTTKWKLSPLALKRNLPER